MSIIKDIGLAPSGRVKIDWAKRHMPVLNEIERDFLKTKPFSGKNVLVSVHVEAKTAYLALVLKSGGANVAVAACNPLSTQDDVAAALAQYGVETFAVHGADDELYYRCLEEGLMTRPQLFIDDGGDLVHMLHTKRRDLMEGILGGSEETTTGVARLLSRSKRGELEIPMMLANDAMMKHLFDNRYGTGQSVFDGINRTTNLIVAGKCVVIAGYGWCGRGAAMRAKGMGARVVITEIDPIKAIEAVMDGFEVMTMDEAAGRGDLFITLTGCRDVITKKHFDTMKDGAVMCNAGHFDVEIDVSSLRESSVSSYEARQNIEGFRRPDGRTLYLLAEGRLVNLAAGDGHPAEIMDMSFSVQAMALKYILDHASELKPTVYRVPAEIDEYVAEIKLASGGVSIDSLTPEQEKYLYG
ncbi:MAG: adenosylhomocysteinase [Clostridia bacterium]|nr:adenosylhomocysteinase [Clostridia bacterium]